MKIAYLQPPYPLAAGNSAREETISFMLNEASRVASDTDLLVLPEYSNCPGINRYDELQSWMEQEQGEFFAKLAAIASSANVNIVANGVCLANGRFMNRTVWIDRQGQFIMHYDKTHLTESERNMLKLTAGHSVRLLEHEGMRIAFATCFELYFSEHFERLASMKPDLIVVPTYQRSEEANIIRLQAAARAMDSGAYLVRASYSMGTASSRGGMSMVADPRGEIVSCAYQETGIFYAEVNLQDKWIRPGSYGQACIAARDIIEANRRPELYRAGASPSSSGIGALRKYQVIAHQGLSAGCPGNTLPAFGAAIAAGADEIEYDIRITKDRELVILHDATVDKTTNLIGPVKEWLWKDLQQCDAGSWFSPVWKGLAMPRVEDIFRHFAGKIRMNIHVYDSGEDGWAIARIGELAYQYNIADQIYFAGDREVMEYALRHAPEIERCCLVEQDSWNLVQNAIQYKCQRLQFFNRYCSESAIREAHDAGIHCNLFYADTAEDADAYYDMGIDSILTNTVINVLSVANEKNQRMG